MKEVWKQVEDYPDYYISNLGRLKSIDRYIVDSLGRKTKRKGKLIKLHKSHKGYLRVKMINGDKHITTSIHRIMAKAFIPNPENKPQVNHINGIKTDNRIENLEWCTNQENQIHAIKNKLIKHNKGEKHHMSLFNNKQVLSIRSEYKECKNYSLLADKYNTSATVIMNLIKRKTYNNI